MRSITFSKNNMKHLMKHGWHFLDKMLQEVLAIIEWQVKSSLTPEVVLLIQERFSRVYNESQKKQDDFQKMMLGFMQNYHTNQPSSSSSLPSNTIPNPGISQANYKCKWYFYGWDLRFHRGVEGREGEKDYGVHARSNQPPPLVHDHTKDKETIESLLSFTNKSQTLFCPYPSQDSTNKMIRGKGFTSFHCNVLWIPEGGHFILEALLNSDPLPSPNQGDYLPGIQKDLKVVEPKKSSVEYATSYEPKRLNPESRA
ncbi:hypothetical protein Tco_1578551 [Tanacetum coccineum]